MADGKIEIGIELDDSGVKSQAEKAGKQAGDALGDGIESGAKSGASGAEGSVKGASSKMEGSLKSVGTVGVAAFGSIVAAAGALVGVANEVGEDFGKLESQIINTGTAADVGNAAYSDMVGLLGEVDTAVEATNSLLGLADGNQKMLEDSTRALSGVFATYGDNIPLEGLAESMQYTAALGEVDGQMADVLERVGINTDDFNASLAECNDEQERAQFIVDTLNGLYGDAGDTYREVNEPLIEYRQNMSDLQQTMSEAGTALMPIVSSLVGSFIPGISAVIPIVEQFSSTFYEAFNAGNLVQAGRQLGQALPAVLSEIVGMLPEFISSGVELVGGIAIGMVQGIPGLVTSIVGAITEAIPMLLESALLVVTALVDSLPDIVQALVDAVPTIIQMIADMIPETIDVLIEGFLQLFNAVVLALPLIIESLLSAMPTIVSSLVSALVGALPTMVQGFVQLFMAFIQALPLIIQTIVPYIPEIVTSIIETLIENLPVLMDGFVQLFMAFISALPQIISIIVAALPQIITSIVSTLISNGPQLLNAAVQLFWAFVDGIGSMAGNVASKAGEIGRGILDEIGKIPGKIFGVGQNIVQGLWNGINDMTGWVIGKIQGFGESVLGGIKDFFGIASPSKLMRDEIGKFIGQGIAVGIPIGFDMKDPMDQVNASIVRGAASLQLASMGNTYNNSSQTVNFNQPIQSPDQVAIMWRRFENHGLAGAR